MFRLLTVRQRRGTPKPKKLLTKFVPTAIPTPKWILVEYGCNICAVIDLCGKMVLSYHIDNAMTASLVTDTLRDAAQKEMVTDGPALHSDQGFQYTSQAYFD